MKKRLIFPLSFALLASLGFTQCQQSTKSENVEKPAIDLHGHQTLEDYGKHLVNISGCHDCHTPRKMGPRGPEMDMELALSGHPTAMPIPDIDRGELESKGIAATQTMTAWLGPWGVSYAGNITSDDETGIGEWTEEQFFIALREGKYRGVRDARPLLPPMPWEVFQNMSDNEIKAIYAYLQSTKPIKNQVPYAMPPTSAM
ncbi:MAG TPA: c-type cytochrome [Anditalea sp.]|nr:c-type cytochrome [Anditalea sp.]